MGKIVKWTMLFVVVVILVSGAFAFYTVFFGEKALSVPPFREMSVVDAVAEAERLGLTVRIEQIESTLPGGRVLAQWPEPGAKIRGDKNLILKISRGGESKPVPDVRGVDFAKATRLLQEQGFAVGDIIRIKESGKVAGEVIAQSPASPANVPVSKKIDLLVSEGPQDGRFPVPDVAQMDEADAREMLTTAGLKIGQIDKVRNRNILDGLVVNTRPAAGTLVRAGTSVRISISAGDIEVVPQTPTTQPSPVNVPGRTPAAILPGTEGDITDVSVLDRQAEIQRQQEIDRISQQPETPRVEPTRPQPTPPPAPSAPGGGKVAKVRYQVPPLTKPLPLVIEIVDPSGTRTLLQRDVRSNERIQVDGNYSQQAVVTISLGGEFVWQEQFK